MERVGLRSNEDVTKTLLPYRVKKDNEDIIKLTNGIPNTMNPFIQETDENLYCITTGKKTSDHTKDDLLSCYEIGLKWQDECTTGCFEDSMIFERPIKRRKI